MLVRCSTSSPGAPDEIPEVEDDIIRSIRGRDAELARRGPELRQISVVSSARRVHALSKVHTIGRLYELEYSFGRTAVVVRVNHVPIALKPCAAMKPSPKEFLIQPVQAKVRQDVASGDERGKPVVFKKGTRVPRCLEGRRDENHDDGARRQTPRRFWEQHGGCGGYGLSALCPSGFTTEPQYRRPHRHHAKRELHPDPSTKCSVAVTRVNRPGPAPHKLAIALTIRGRARKSMSINVLSAGSGRPSGALEARTSAASGAAMPVRETYLLLKSPSKGHRDR